MGKCDICGKPTTLNFHFCKKCSEKIKKGEIEKCPHCGAWKNAKEKCQKCAFPLNKKDKSFYPHCEKQVKTYFGKEMMFDTKEETRIADIIVENGYVFDHDQEYPYTDNQNGLRYDFRLLKRDGSDFKTRIFIESKCNREKDYTEEIIKKKDICEKHGDKLLYSNKSKENEIIEKLKTTIEEIKKEN